MDGTSNQTRWPGDTLADRLAAIDEAERESAREQEAEGAELFGELAEAEREAWNDERGDAIRATEREAAIDAGFAKARALMDRASTPLAVAIETGRWPNRAAGLDEALTDTEIEVAQTPTYLALKRQLDCAHETIRQKNEEYAALLAEARPEQSLEVAMLRNRSKEWESLTAENARLKLQLAAMTERTYGPPAGTLAAVAADTNGGTK